MATVTRENIGLLNDKLTVTIAKEDYLPAFEKALKNYSKSANIPGFRKGMVPAGLIRKMHGQSVMTDEVLRSVEKQLTDYMTQEKLEIFAQPLPMEDNDITKIDANNPADYTFSFEIGLKPEFKVADLASADLTRYVITVTDEMVSEEIERLQLRNGKMTEPEAVTSEENVLNVSFIESDADGNELEGGIKKDNSLLVKYFAPAVRTTLIGKKKDDSLVIKLNEAFEDKEREWIMSDLGLSKDDTANADKHFKVQITKVGLVEKAELNEEFFKQIFGDSEITTVEGFREAIKNDIAKQWAMHTRNQLHDQIFHALIDHTPIEFPEQFLKRWMQNGGKEQKSEEEVNAEFPQFVNQLKWTLIMDKLTADNNIEVSAEDIRDFAKQQLLGYMGGMTADLDQPWVEDYVQRMMNDRKYVEDAYQRIRSEKLFAWAESQTNPKEKELSAEDFNEMVKNHHH